MLAWARLDRSFSFLLSGACLEDKLLRLLGFCLNTGLVAFLGEQRGPSEFFIHNLNL